MANFKAKQEKYKISLEHFVAPESKEVVKKMKWYRTDPQKWYQKGPYWPNQAISSIKIMKLKEYTPLNKISHESIEITNQY